MADIRYAKEGRAQAFFNQEDSTTYVISNQISKDSMPMQK